MEKWGTGALHRCYDSSSFLPILVKTPQKQDENFAHTLVDQPAPEKKHQLKEKKKKSAKREELGSHSAYHVRPEVKHD